MRLVLSIIALLSLLPAVFSQVLVLNPKDKAFRVGQAYNIGDTVLYQGSRYKVITPHVGQADWFPGCCAALWQMIETVPGVGGISPVGPANATTPNSNRFPSRLFAPYVDILLWPTLDVSSLISVTGVKHFTLAFIISDPAGNPSWGGVVPYTSGFYKDVITRLRAVGGDVIISFGGANGIELAQSNTNAQTLKDKYAAVLDAYQANAIDLDIEGGAIIDNPSIERRNQALAMLKKERPNLRVSYTLPVLPTGLTAAGVNILADAKKKGLAVDVVNIMAMDYGGAVAPKGDTDMGKYAISAATNTYKQATPHLGTKVKIGVCPMIGKNDVQGEIFQLENAEELLKWASSTSYVSMISMWSYNRDNSKVTEPLYACSQIAQKDWAFSAIFSKFTTKDASEAPPSSAKSTKKAAATTTTKQPATTRPLGVAPLPSSPGKGEKGFGGRIFAPYVDSTAWPPFDIVAAFQNYGIRYFTLAFIVSDTKGNPSWGGYYSLSDNWYLDRITQLRNLGGDVIISFGGAAGKELGLTNRDAKVLQQRYQSVIDKYKVKWIDLDIEGSALEDLASIKTRNTALKALKAANPGLIISYTLPVDVYGLPNSAIALLKDAHRIGLKVDVVNLMTMNFAPSAAPLGSSLMSQYVIESTQNAYNQVQNIGLDGTRIGVTPMIGLNDIQTQVFRLEDALKILNWAKTVPWIQYVSYWSLGRDNGNLNAGIQSASGIVQGDFAFAQVLTPFTAA